MPGILYVESEMKEKGTAEGKKHGFYSRALDEAERLELEEAGMVEGIDEEIAMLRVKLRDVGEVQLGVNTTPHGRYLNRRISVLLYREN